MIKFDRSNLNLMQITSAAGYQSISSLPTEINTGHISQNVFLPSHQNNQHKLDFKPQQPVNLSNLSKYEAARALQQADSSRFRGLENQLAPGKLIDFKIKQDWVVARVIRVNQLHVAVRLARDLDARGKKVPITSDKLAPFRFFTNKSNCDIPRMFDEIDFVLIQQTQRQVDDAVRSQFKCFRTAHDLTQFVSGELVSLTQFLLNLDEQSYDQLTHSDKAGRIFSFLVSVFSLTIAWSRLMPQNKQGVLESLQYPMLVCLDFPVALSLCGRHLTRLLGIAFNADKGKKSFKDRFRRELFSEFCRLDGCFQAITDKETPIVCLVMVLTQFTDVKALMDANFACQFYSEVANFLGHQIANLTDEQLRDTEAQDLDRLLKLYKVYNQHQVSADHLEKWIEESKVKLAMRCLTCPFSSVRIRGITFLQKTAVMPFDSDKTKFEFKEVMKTAGVFQVILSKPTAEILSRSTEIFSLLTQNDISSELATELWLCSVGTDAETRKAALRLLLKVIQSCSEEVFQSVWQEISSIDSTQSNEEHIHFLRDLMVQRSDNFQTSIVELLWNLSKTVETENQRKLAIEAIFKSKNIDQMSEELFSLALVDLQKQLSTKQSLAFLRKLLKQLTSEGLLQIFQHIEPSLWNLALTANDKSVAKEARNLLVSLSSRLPNGALNQLIHNCTQRLKQAQASDLGRHNMVRFLQTFIAHFDPDFFVDELSLFNCEEMAQFPCEFESQQEPLLIHPQMTFYHVLAHASQTFKKPMAELEIMSNEGPLEQKFYCHKVVDFIREPVALYFAQRDQTSSPIYMLAQNQEIIDFLINMADGESGEQSLCLFEKLPLNKAKQTSWQHELEARGVEQVFSQDFKVSAETLYTLTLLDGVQIPEQFLSKLFIRFINMYSQRDLLVKRILVKLLQMINRTQVKSQDHDLLHLNLALLKGVIFEGNQRQNLQLYKQSFARLSVLIDSAKMVRELTIENCFAEIFQAVWILPHFAELASTFSYMFVTLCNSQKDDHSLSQFLIRQGLFKLLPQLVEAPSKHLLTFLETVCSETNALQSLDNQNQTEHLKQIAGVFQQAFKSGKLVPKLMSLAITIFSKLKPQTQFGSEFLRFLMNECLFASNDTKEMIRLISVLCGSLEGLGDTVAETIAKIAIKDCEHWGQEQVSIEIARKETDYCGLRNLGQTCYINSFLQQLFMIPLLSDLVLSAQLSNEQTILPHLKSLFVQMKFSDLAYVDTTTFCTEVFENLGINPHDQQDTFQFFNLLIDRLETDLRGTPHERSLKQNFEIICANKITSRECFHSSDRESSEMAITLDIKGKASLEEALHAHISTELLENENLYHCEHCGQKRCAQKRHTFKQLPNVLVIVLKRLEFDFEGNQAQKLNSFCSFPMDLDMRPFSDEAITQETLFDQIAEGSISIDQLSEEQQANLNRETVNDYFDFKLGGVIIHKGDSDRGHYYSLIRDRQAGSWLCFDDTIVTSFDVKEMARKAFGGEDPTFAKRRERCAFDSHVFMSKNNENAYILVYQRAQPINYDTYHNLMEVKEPIEPSELSRNSFAQAIIKHQQHEHNNQLEVQFRQLRQRQLVKSVLLNEETVSFLGDQMQLMVKHDLNYSAARSQSLQQDQQPSEFHALRELATYFLVVAQRTTSASFRSQFQKAFSKCLEINIPLAIWLVETFTNHRVIHDFLSHCHDPDLAQTTIELLRVAIQAILPFEEAQFKNYVGNQIRSSNLTQAAIVSKVPTSIPTLLPLSMALTQHVRQVNPLKFAIQAKLLLCIPCVQDDRLSFDVRPLYLPLI